MKPCGFQLVGLLVSGGRVLCRDRECFYALDQGIPRLKVLRFVGPEEVVGHLCAHCREELAPVPWLKPPCGPRMIGARK